MGTDGVVVASPGGDLVPRVGFALEPIQVQALGAKLADEELNECVLHGLATLNETGLYAPVLGPLVECLLVKSGPLSTMVLGQQCLAAA